MTSKTQRPSLDTDHEPAESRLRPLALGQVEVGFPVVQAALSGYSDWAMRVIARRLGASYVMCEVMLDQFLLQVRERQRTRHFLHLSDEERPVGGQLMGAEPEQFAEGAKRLVQAGFDVIDINFGCPVKKGARQMPRRLSLEPARCCTGSDPPHARCGPACRAGYREDAARSG